MIALVELSSPPGVLISINTAWSLLRWASSIARVMYSALMGWIVSFTTTFRIWAEAGNEKRTTAAMPVTMAPVSRNLDLLLIDLTEERIDQASESTRHKIPVVAI